MDVRLVYDLADLLYSGNDVSGGAESRTSCIINVGHKSDAHTWRCRQSCAHVTAKEASAPDAPMSELRPNVINFFWIMLNEQLTPMQNTRSASGVPAAHPAVKHTVRRSPSVVNHMFFCASHSNLKACSLPPSDIHCTHEQATLMISMASDCVYPQCSK